jgi:serine/threonine-protein kinase ATR
LASILAVLLAQPSPDPETMIMSIFTELSQEFKIHDLAGWVRVEPILIACELLKGLGDSGKDTESEVRHDHGLWS